MRELLDRLEGAVIVRASFKKSAFVEWLEQIKQQLDLMALVGQCQLHAVGRVPGHTCGCGIRTPLAEYPADCCLALVRSHLLLEELDLTTSWLDMHAREYARAGEKGIERSFTEWLRERMAADLATMTGWCGAVHHAVLTLSCDEFDAGRVTAMDLALLRQIERLEG